MKTFWVRLHLDFDVKINAVDNWKTGENEERKINCFAIRANEESDVHDFLDKLLCSGSFQVDFVEERPWKKFKDFCLVDGRFSLAEKYLEDNIDTVEQCLSRL